MADFGTQLRDLRVRIGLTQTDLAKASNLGQSTISALETGRQGPWPSTRKALAHAFHMTLEEFDEAIVGGVVADPPSSRPLGVGRARRPVGAIQRSAPPSSVQRFAPAKVMDLLEDLGRAEEQLKQYQASIDHVFAACWLTDATLHITGALGPVAAEQRNRHGDFVGRHVTEFFELAWGEQSPDFTPLVMQQRAVDGESVSFSWALGGRRYMIYVDPIKDDVGKVVGTLGTAIDVTDRRHHEAEPPAG